MAKPFTPTLGMLLRRLVELLDGDLEQVYRESGLDYRPRYTPVVRALTDYGPCAIRDIAAHAGITHSAASQTVKQMTRAGLLTQTAGVDARERVVRMAPRLRRMLPRIRNQWTATNDAAETLDRELPYSLHSVVSQAIAALERQPFRERIAKSAGVAAQGSRVRSPVRRASS